MAWVRGLFVLLTVSVDVGVRMAVQSTAPPLSVPNATVSNGLSNKAIEPFSHSTKQTLQTTSANTGRTSSTPALKPTRTNSNAKGRSSFESVVILSSANSQQDAEEMYDKALRHYDENVYTTRQMCSAWEKRGCQCTGTIEQLTLSCRAIGLNETPTDLPKSLIKL